MKDGENIVIQIWDVDNNRYWHSPRGEHRWGREEYAKNCWNCAFGYRRNEDGVRMLWDDHEETSRGFVIHRFRLQRTGRV